MALTFLLVAAENPGFFSDPKVILSLLAIVISLGNLIWSLANQSEQNRRWDLLNTGSVDLKKADLKTWRKMKREEAMATNWGYIPTVVTSSETDECRLLCRLRAYESAAQSSSPIDGMNIALTADDMEKEIHRLGLKSPPVLVYKDYTFLFELENSGKTESSNCTAIVFALIPNEAEREIFRSRDPIKILPGRSATIPVEMSWAPAKPLARALGFRLVVYYSDPHGRAVQRETTVSWDAEKNEWAYGELPGVRGHG